MNVKKTILTFLKLCLSVGLIFYLLKNAELEKIWAYIKEADYLLLSIAFIMFYVGYYFSGVRLKSILEGINIDAKIGYLIRSFTIGMLFNNLLPSTVGGDAYRMYDVWRISQDKTKSFSSVFLDRFFGLFALVTLAVLSLFFVPDINQHIPGIYFYLSGLWLAMGFVLWSVFNKKSKLVDWLLNLNIPFVGFIQNFFKKLVNSVFDLRGRYDIKIKAIIFSVLIQLNMIFHFILVAYALNIDLPWFSMFIIMPLSNIVLLLPISINGVGVREAVFVFFFAIFGANAESAIAFAWVGLAMVLLQGLVGGIVFLMRRSETRNYVEPAE